VRCRRLQDLLVLQGTTKSTRKKSQDFSNSTYNRFSFRFSISFISCRYNFSVPFSEGLSYGGRPFNNQTGEGLWIEVAEGYIQIPYLESEIESQTKFVKQNCFVKMGK